MQLVGAAFDPQRPVVVDARSARPPISGAASAAASPAISARSQRRWVASAAGVGARQQQQVGDQAAHPPRGAQRRVDHLAVFGLLAAAERGLQQLQVGEHAGQRRAQLVRGVGDELALLLHRLLALGARGVERAQHLLQRLGQFADLVFDRRAGHVPGGVAGLGDLPRARGQRGDRPHRPAGDRHPGEAGQQRAAEDPGDDQQPDAVDRRRRRGRCCGRTGRSRWSRRSSLSSAVATRMPPSSRDAGLGRSEARRVRFGDRLPSSVEDADRGVVGQHVGRRAAGPFAPRLADRRCSRPGFALARISDRVAHLAVEVVADPAGGDLADRRRRRPSGSPGSARRRRAARRQRTGQARGCTTRRSQAAVLLRAAATISL